MTALPSTICDWADTLSIGIVHIDTKLQLHAPAMIPSDFDTFKSSTLSQATSTAAFNLGDPSKDHNFRESFVAVYKLSPSLEKHIRRIGFESAGVVHSSFIVSRSQSFTLRHDVTAARWNSVGLNSKLVI
jgi:hypothetical protein